MDYRELTDERLEFLSDANYGEAWEVSRSEILSMARDLTGARQRIAELEKQLATARQEAIEEAAAECHGFVEAYFFHESYPEGYKFSRKEQRAALEFAYGRFKVCEASIRALADAKEK